MQSTRFFRHIFRHIMLSVVSCLLIVGVSLPSFSHQVALLVQSDNQIAKPAQQQIVAHWRAAELALAKDTGAIAQTSTAKYSVVLTGTKVAPKIVVTGGSGFAGAVLSGDRLAIQGNFKKLSSQLRDYATDPLNPPNPKITSGIHIHQGEATKNGPFQYALTVEPAVDGLSGDFKGEYTLTPEQLQALSTGMLYLDLHTKRNRAGELRGVFKLA
jgi:CHRD domain